MNRRSGLALSICAARCLRKRKCLPSFFGRLTPPPAALPRSPPGYENWVRRLKRRGQRSQSRCASSLSPTNHLKTSLVAIPILGHTSGKIAIQRENCRETPTVQPPRQGITPTPSQPLIPQFPGNCAEIKNPICILTDNNISCSVNQNEDLPYAASMLEIMPLNKTSTKKR